MSESMQVKDYREINKKKKLSEVIPLDAPYLVQISCADFCNFKCNFCFQSIGMDELKKVNFNPEIMTLETFKKIADQVRQFPSKVKAFRFTGFGEPLMNKDLPEMIRYAKENEIAEKITIFTNASLLTPELNLKLIDSGLDEIMISIEGLSAEKYYEITGTQIDFAKFIANLRHLFVNKKNCKVYAKIIDVGMTDEAEFHRIFDPISDLAFVEYASNAYENVVFTKDLECNYVGEKPIERIEVCHLPFYYMYINSNGEASSCHIDYTKDIKFGNVWDKNLVDIWNGKEMNDFRIMHLKKQRHSHPICGKCNWVSVCACGIYENIIDDSAERLLTYYE